MTIDSSCPGAGHTESTLDPSVWKIDLDFNRSGVGLRPRVIRPVLGQSQSELALSGTATLASDLSELPQCQAIKSFARAIRQLPTFTESKLWTDPSQSLLDAAQTEAQSHPGISEVTVIKWTTSAEPMTYTPHRKVAREAEYEEDRVPEDADEFVGVEGVEGLKEGSLWPCSYTLTVTTNATAN